MCNVGSKISELKINVCELESLMEATIYMFNSHEANNDHNPHERLVFVHLFSYSSPVILHVN